MPDAEDTSSDLHRAVSLTGSARLPPGESDAFSTAPHHTHCHAASAGCDDLTQLFFLRPCICLGVLLIDTQTQLSTPYLNVKKEFERTQGRECAEGMWMDCYLGRHQSATQAARRAPGTARERYQALLADADNVSRAEYSRFGGTVGRSMFRPGAPSKHI